MKERPLLFSGAMVRGILAGAKTQTRRVVKPQPKWLSRVRLTAAGWAWKQRGRLGVEFNGWPRVDAFARAMAMHCPYGVPGDRLWVRETFRQGDGCMTVHYAADPDEVSGGPWRPSIFMPRWASRLNLAVTEVRVQRLQEISEEDAEAEGMLREDLPSDPENFHPPGSYGYVSGLEPFPNGRIHPSAREAFAEAWDSIQLARDYRASHDPSWKANPWVWAISFRRAA